MSVHRKTVPRNWVPIPAAPRTPSKDGEARLHGVLEPDRLSGVVDLRLVTVDALHVGSGNTVVARTGGKDEIFQDIALRRGVPIIPGSSIKGTLRSQAEAIGGGCDLLERCGPPPCVICALFGHVRGSDAALMGRLGVGDALLESRASARKAVGARMLPRAFSPRKDEGRRAYAPAVGELPKQVPTLVVRPGMAFRAPLELVNVRPEELGLVLTAAGVGQGFAIRIGGGRYAGLGRVRVEVIRARLRRGYRQPRVETLEGGALDQAVKAWLAAFRPSAEGRKAIEVLRRTGEVK